MTSKEIIGIKEINAFKTSDGQIFDSEVECVNAFKTSDGQIFVNETDAHRHESRIVFKKYLEDKQKYGYEDYKIYGDEILEWVDKNRIAIAKYLKSLDL